MVAISAFTGCSGGGSTGTAPPLSGQSGPSRGLVRDLDAAVRFAASRNDMVVVAITQHEAEVRAYEMKTVRDEPAALQIMGVRETPTEPRRMSDLAMTARVGRFGNAERERQLLEDIRLRLAETSDDPFAASPHPDTLPPR